MTTRFGVPVALPITFPLALAACRDEPATGETSARVSGTVAQTSGGEGPTVSGVR